MSDRLLTTLRALADRALPEGTVDPELVRRGRVSIAQVALGVPAALVMSALYGAMGSPVSAIAIGSIAIVLLCAPLLLRRGASIVAVGNAIVAHTFVVTAIVALRTGGAGSPAVAWTFLLPIAIYAIGGLRSAIVWTLASLGLVVGLYGAAAPSELDARGAAILRGLGYAGVLAATATVLVVLERARLRHLAAVEDAERERDRKRILDDMHDGIGSHLLGLLVEARAGTLGAPELVAGLETSLDDLRLIVDSLDPLHASLDAALAALRGRIAARCESLDVELRWESDEARLAAFAPAEGAQVLRAVQEMVSNALRHARASRLEVRVALPIASGPGVEIAVVDDGVGLPVGETPSGRGMNSLRTRAHRLGGALRLEPRAPGLRVAIELPARG